MTLESRLENVQNQLNTVCELLQLTITSLNTKKSVAKFLNKSEKTIDNYIKNKTFILNKHYYINENKRIEFIPFSIVDFKKNPNYKREEQKDKTIYLSKTTSSILKGIIE